MRFTEQQVRDYEARMKGVTPELGHAIKAKVERELDLHNIIIAHCRACGWQYLHGSMAAETHRTLGEPDFIILANQGRVLLIECKSRDGKLSPVQRDFKAHAEHNGHQVHIVRSMEEFLTVCQ